MKIKDVWTRLILFADKFFTADTPIKNPVCGYLDGFATIEYLQPLSFYMYLNHCLRTVHPKVYRSIKSFSEAGCTNKDAVQELWIFYPTAE